MGKRVKIVFATISVAGYTGRKKVTNTIKWRVFLINEKDPDGLIEKEREKVLAAVIDGAKGKSSGVEFHADVTKKEERFADSYLTADPFKIGETEKVQMTLKQQ